MMHLDMPPFPPCPDPDDDGETGDGYPPDPPMPPPSMVMEYRGNLPFLACRACGGEEFTVGRSRLKLRGVEGDTVVNRVECCECGEVVTLAP